MTQTLDQTPALDDRLGTLRALAAAGAQQADENGTLAPGAIDAIVQAGFTRHFVPARFGGTEGTITDLTRAVTSLGESCTSTAWCAVMFAYAARFATHLPLEAQQEAWDGSPDAIWVSGLVPAGSATPVDGGFTVSGTWNWVSGGQYADWAILAGPQQGPDALPPMYVAVPKSEFRIEQTWNSVGMRATASNALVIDETFVPAHRTVSLPSVMAGMNAVSDVVQHNLPLPSVGGLTCAPAALGAARAALAAVVDLIAAKPRTPVSPPGAGSPIADLAIARASVQIETAQFLVERAAGVLDGGGARPLGIRNARDCAYAAELLVEAVGELMRAGGTSAQDRNSSLQRAWRDVTVATSHAALRFDKPAGAYTAGLISPPKRP